MHNGVYLSVYFYTVVYLACVHVCCQTLAK